MLFNFFFRCSQTDKVNLQLILDIKTVHCLEQRGPTAFGLRAILHKRDKLRVTSNKIMYKTIDSQDLKLKKGS